MSFDSIKYHLVENEEGGGIIVVVPGRSPGVANSDHPNYAKIVEGAKVGDASVIDLFNVEETVSKAFEILSERVSVRNGVVYFDGDPIDDSIANQILRFMDEGEEFAPLVNFLEKVMANPQEHSRTQLYDFLKSKEFTIIASGDFVAYKGVNKLADGSFVSGFSGKAIVNGELHEGQIPNPVGGVVEMPRSEVVWNPQAHCTVGLHAGTFDYAQGYARGAMLEVWINPRDVVSVPDDSGEKLRCCRYYIVDTIDAPHSSALRDTSGYNGWGELDEEEYDEYVYEDEEDEAEHDFLLELVGKATTAGSISSVGKVNVGDRFIARDSRRKSTVLTVKSISGDYASCQSSLTGRTTSVDTDRLLARYDRV